MFYKLTVKLTCVVIFLFAASYVYPESISQEQDKALKVAEIKSFLQEYDPQDINANPPEELKAALLEFNNKYGSMFEEKEMLMDKEKEIYKDKNAGEMRFIAFVRLFSLFGQNPEFRLDGKNQIEFLTEALQDNNSKIRLFAAGIIRTMRDMFSSEDVSQEFKEEDYAPFKDAVKIYDRIKEDSLFKRFFGYSQDSLKGDSEDRISKIFNDPDPGVRYMLLFSAQAGYGLSSQSAESFLIYRCLKDRDLWNRFDASKTLIQGYGHEQKYVTEACRTFADLLEEFFKNIDANNIYFFTAKLSVPLEALPDKAVLERIFNDKDSNVFKRATLFKLLRNSLSAN